MLHKYAQERYIFAQTIPCITYNCIAWIKHQNVWAFAERNEFINVQFVCFCKLFNASALIFSAEFNMFYKNQTIYHFYTFWLTKNRQKSAAGEFVNQRSCDSTGFSNKSYFITNGSPTVCVRDTV